MLVLLSVTLIALDSRTGALSPLRSVAGSALGPLQRAVGIRVASDTVLHRENASLRQQLADARLDRVTAEQLRAVDLLATSGGYRVRPARVVALSASAGPEWTATLGIGTVDGVRSGQTVVDGDGLVGRVLRTAARTSVVLLAVDPTSTVGARLEGSREVGLCRGAGRRGLGLTLLDPRAAVAVGDEVVTGPARVTTFTPGVPVGRVRAVSRSTDGLVRTAEVEPAVDFTALDLVGVVVPAR